MMIGTDISRHCKLLEKSNNTEDIHVLMLMAIIAGK